MIGLSPGSIVEPGFSCPLVPHRKGCTDGRCHDRVAEDPFPAVAAADDGPGVRASGAGRRRDQSDLRPVLLRLTEIELETRAANAVATRIKKAEFPVLKDFDTYDFSVMPRLSKPKVLELSRCEWIEHNTNCCLVGNQGTGKTHIAVALGQAACRAGLRVRFFTAAELVSKLEACRSSTPWTDSWANWSERSS